MLESKFQSGFIKKLRETFSGCVILKNDPTYIQGFPDLLILHKNKWAALECKRGTTANKQPNQDYYVDKLNNMSYASFVCPENEEEVLHELQQTFRTGRSPRVSKR